MTVAELTKHFNWDINIGVYLADDDETSRPSANLIWSEPLLHAGTARFLPTLYDNAIVTDWLVRETSGRTNLSVWIRKDYYERWA